MRSHHLFWHLLLGLSAKKGCVMQFQSCRQETSTYKDSIFNELPVRLLYKVLCVFVLALGIGRHIKKLHMAKDPEKIL